MSDSEDTTHFTVHAADDATRRRFTENAEEYGGRILAQFDTELEESSFVPRALLQ